MKKTNLYRGLLIAVLAAIPVLVFAQGAAEVKTGLNSFADIIKTLTEGVVRALVTLFATAAMAVFFFGIVKYLFGIKDGDKTAIENGNKFMIYGLVALFVMFSVWGIVTMAQRIFGIEGKTNIIIPDVNFQKGSSGTGTGNNGTGAGLPGSGSTGAGLGEFCQQNSSCRSGLECRDFTCKSPVSSSGSDFGSRIDPNSVYINNACQDNSHCTGGSTCVDGVCRMPATSGDSTAWGYDPGNPGGTTQAEINAAYVDCEKTDSCAY